MQEAATPRLDRQRHLYQLADNQGGVFTAAQAKQLGYSYRSQHHHKQNGNWLDAGWGIYRLRHYPHTQQEHLVRLTLWSRNRQGQPQAVASHDTALALYDLSDLLPATTHLTVPPTFRKKPPEHVQLHKARLEPDDIREHGGYRVTSPLRTLLDVIDSHVSPEHVEQAIHQALERGLVRHKQLEQALEARPGETQEQARAILERA